MKSEYIYKLERRYEKSLQGYKAHKVSFLAVNLGIFLLNMITSPGYPWFLFVLGGWGIGLVSQYATCRLYAMNLKEARKSAQPDMLKKYHKLQRDFWLHATSNGAVAVYLLMINFLTSPGFLWALIPSVFMGIGVAIHWGNLRNRLSNIYRGDEAVEDVLKEPVEDIIDVIQKKYSSFAGDFLPMVDEYADMIQTLREKRETLSDILKDISEDELFYQEEELKRKLDSAESQGLKLEYEKFLADILKRKDTVKNLHEQREILNLRIEQAVNSLKQLHLDLIRMDSTTLLEESGFIADFEEKTRELTLYYKDLVESYKELNS